VTIQEYVRLKLNGFLFAAIGRTKDAQQGSIPKRGQTKHSHTRRYPIWTQWLSPAIGGLDKHFGWRRRDHKNQINTVGIESRPAHGRPDLRNPKGSGISKATAHTARI
jgi:hypothetical protein